MILHSLFGVTVGCEVVSASLGPGDGDAVGDAVGAGGVEGELEGSLVG